MGKRGNVRATFVQVQSSDAEDTHELVFAVQQRNLVEMDKLLMERSTPGNPLYQKWLTFEEVGEMTSNTVGAQAVEDWLSENNISVTWKSAHSDYIKATAKISKWEEMLDTKFFEFEDKARNIKKGTKIHRAHEYSLPEHVVPHLSGVFNTVQVPPVMSQKYYTLPDGVEKVFKQEVTFSLRQNEKKVQAYPQVTVQFLNDYYGMNGLDGNASMQQSVFETSEMYFSPNDLTQFQNTYSLQVKAASAPFGFTTSNCKVNDDDTTGVECGEGNLDVQYIMGVAPSIATIYWYIDSSGNSDPFLDWATDVSNTPNPPLSNSISWGSVEQANAIISGGASMTAFDTEAMKLGIQGVSIMVSSGDDGVASKANLCNSPSGSANYHTWNGTPWSGKGYFPSYPATSPYVTAVGATSGPESGQPEVASQSQLGDVITTGGGFSTFYPTPSWQQSAVTSYLAQSTATPGYNPNGRGYPDISMIGVWYQVMMQGALTSVFGTSASAPVLAAMVSLVNTARVKEGKPPVGFMNPTLYAADPAYFNDVTSGINNCIAYGYINNPSGATCCESGFDCKAGWDPVTGHGSINYINMLNLFNNTVPVPIIRNSAAGSGLSVVAVATAAVLLIWQVVMLA